MAFFFLFRLFVMEGLLKNVYELHPPHLNVVAQSEPGIQK